MPPRATEQCPAIVARPEACPHGKGCLRANRAEATAADEPVVPSSHDDEPPGEPVVASRAIDVGRLRQSAMTAAAPVPRSIRASVRGAAKRTGLDACWRTRQSCEASTVPEPTARTSIAAFNPSMSAVRLPVDGSTCSTLEVPAGNGKPRNSVTSSWPACVRMPVGTASTSGPPIVGNAGFGTGGNSTSGEDRPVGMCRAVARVPSTSPR